MQRFFPISHYIKAKSGISMFRQGSNEFFCETWERFKMMLRKCPNHGFKDISQLRIFLNGLRSDTKMLLDTAACGTMVGIDMNQATRIIDALATIDYQAQNDRQGSQKRGLLEIEQILTQYLSN